jgi:hypothetical protein
MGWYMVRHRFIMGGLGWPILHCIDVYYDIEFDIFFNMSSFVTTNPSLKPTHKPISLYHTPAPSSIAMIERTGNASNVSSQLEEGMMILKTQILPNYRGLSLGRSTHNSSTQNMRYLIMTMQPIIENHKNLWTPVICIMLKITKIHHRAIN